MRSFVSERAKETPISGIRVIFEKAQRVSDVIRLEVGEPDFDTPEHIRAAAVRALNKGETHYTSSAGVLELREEISRKFRVDNSLEYDAKTQIVVSAGAVNSLNLALMTIIDPGDEVLIPDPGWANYEVLIGLAQGVPVRYPLRERNSFKSDPEELRGKISPKTKAIIVCTPSNPTGSVLDIRHLQEIASIAEEYDLMVISDEVYEKIIYGNAVHQSIGALPGMANRVVTVNAFSKTYAMTGWRLGYAGGPSEVIGQMIKLNTGLNTCASSISQIAGIEALRGPQDSVRQMREEYLRRRDFLLERLRQVPGFTCVVPEGAFYSFPNIQKFGLSSFDFAMALLDRAKVSTVPGSAFGPLGEGYVRFSYANSMERIGKAMDRIQEAIRSGLKVNKA
jgi:aspartate/methionine/tyrosine aminotransferase